jgi:hypothetical protein
MRFYCLNGRREIRFIYRRKAIMKRIEDVSIPRK